VFVLNERHLKRLVNDYVRHYHGDRTHLLLGKDTPAGQEAATKSRMGGRISAMPRLGGLQHRYDLEHFSYYCRALRGSLNQAFASSAVSSGSSSAMA
jgi:hypothetical protein